MTHQALLKTELRTLAAEYELKTLELIQHLDDASEFKTKSIMSRLPTRLTFLVKLQEMDLTIMSYDYSDLMKSLDEAPQ